MLQPEVKADVLDKLEPFLAKFSKVSVFSRESDPASFVLVFTTKEFKHDEEVEDFVTELDLFLSGKYQELIIDCTSVPGEGFDAKRFAAMYVEAEVKLEEEILLTQESAKP